jgi:ferredoxin-NADP reductase
MLVMPTPLLQVFVRAISYEAEDILSFELVHPAGLELPAFTAGAHLDVHMSTGLVRQYSLCNDPAERLRYVIAVLHEPMGKGGSKFMHESVRPGDTLYVSEPRNYFPLAAEAKRHLLLAGGIGITPIMAMVAELARNGADFTLHYCARSPEKTAFRDRLLRLAEEGRVVFYHDSGDPNRGLDLAELLRVHAQGTHVYHCGPAGFMSAARAATTHWPGGSVHFEYFERPSEPDEKTADRANRPFRVRLAQSGKTFTVPADNSIVQVLRQHGIEVDTNCEEGYCGTCLTRYLQGQPEHRDIVLDDSDRVNYVLICCARAVSEELVLDL